MSRLPHFFLWVDYVSICEQMTTFCLYSRWAYFVFCVANYPRWQHFVCVQIGTKREFQNLWHIYWTILCKVKCCDVRWQVSYMCFDATLQPRGGQIGFLKIKSNLKSNQGVKNYVKSNHDQIKPCSFLVKSSNQIIKSNSLNTPNLNFKFWREDHLGTELLPDLAPGLPLPQVTLVGRHDHRNLWPGSIPECRA